MFKMGISFVEDVQSWAGNSSFADVDWQNDDVGDLVKNINDGKRRDSCDCGRPSDCARKEREARIKKSAENYAANLEKLCLLHPYQWYNFFDFWG